LASIGDRLREVIERVRVVVSVDERLSGEFADLFGVEPMEGSSEMTRR
jgi:hypothetical protein